MLESKIALVTGAGRGIGRAIAVRMAAAGADVALLDFGVPEEVEETAAQVMALGRKAGVWLCDVSNFQRGKECVEQVIGDFGGVDILVNNAGITRDALLLSMKPEDFDAVINVNLKGAFNMAKHLCGHFIKKRAGRIINISSVSGISGNAGQANYSSSKAGLIGLTKSLARELAARNITVNAIAPGIIETDMTAKLPEKAREALLAQIPLKRVGSPDDVAALAVFLASGLADYITGEIVKVDGGLCI